MKKAILLDIEGTTTPISFVHDVLFPYARRHAERFLTPTTEDAATAITIEALRQEHKRDLETGAQPPPWSPLNYVHWLMDADRKSTALKALQGRIWEEGYRTGTLRGEVFADVPPALQKWSAEGRDVRIYSSGSIQAQKLIFSCTPYGDLTALLRGYFDTTTGPKMDTSSYRVIAAAFGRAASEILFISDATRELEAAQAAGLEVLLSLRPGNPPQPTHEFRTICSLEEVP